MLFAGGGHEGPARLILEAVQHPLNLLGITRRFAGLGRLGLGRVLLIVLRLIGPGRLLFWLLVHFIPERLSLLVLFAFGLIFLRLILLLFLIL